MWPLAQASANNEWAERIDALARTPLSQIVVLVTICTVLRISLAPYLAKIPPKHKVGGAYRAARFFNELFDAIIYAGIFVFLLIRPFALQAFRIPSGSMLETLQINDFIVANKFIYRISDPKVNDIVVFRPPVRACEPNQIDSDGQVKADFIKRCVGVPGNIIEIRGGKLYRDGKLQDEPWVRADSPSDFKLVKYKGDYFPVSIFGTSVNPAGATKEPYVAHTLEEQEALMKLPAAPIPPGFVLCVGDNRPNSLDGRYWGLVPREDVIGRSEAVWWPPKRWRITR
ncbi:MAG: signal peptidase I [Fimbriimonadaceae bacterium]